uniref:ATP citrate synthase n=1 Tax=Meloidogyne hapla TaxID=6305 RepID=A0A1I8BCU3_MELHA
MTGNEISQKIQSLFENDTKAIIWEQQKRAIQGMMDFDYVCRRECPSVSASTYPFTGDHKQKFYFGQNELLVPAYKSMEKAFRSHPDASVMITFASMRSVFDTVVEALQFSHQIKVIAIIAEGVPENQTRKLIKIAREKGVVIIGPATVAGIKPGTVAGIKPGFLVLLNNILAHNTDGVFEGIAIGGDRYPGSTFTDNILRFQDDPRVKMLVLLGELGGEEKYKIAEALESKRITKPLIAWCIGTCADHIISDVQFGHAGASANFWIGVCGLVSERVNMFQWILKSKLPSGGQLEQMKQVVASLWRCRKWRPTCVDAASGWWLLIPMEQFGAIHSAEW